MFYYACTRTVFVTIRYLYLMIWVCGGRSNNLEIQMLEFREYRK